MEPKTKIQESTIASYEVAGAHYSTSFSSQDGRVSRMFLSRGSRTAPFGSQAPAFGQVEPSELTDLIAVLQKTAQTITEHGLTVSDPEFRDSDEESVLA